MTMLRYPVRVVVVTLFAASPLLAQTRVTGRVSVRATGAQLDGHSAEPNVSPTGRYAVFLSEVTSLAGCAGTSSGTFWGTGIAHIYLRDRQTGATECVSRGPGGLPGNGRSEQPAVSAGGNIVVFVSRATNLVGPATTARLHVFAHNRSTVTTELVSVATNGVSEGDADSTSPRVSDDGRYVVFASRATNLTGIPTATNRVHVYRRDLTAGTTVLVSAPSGSGEADGHSGAPSISSDARLVAFSSTATNLLASADVNGAVADVFVRDVQAATTELISRSSASIQANGTSSDPAITADGRIVAFGSSASNLAPSTADPAAFIFVRDRQASTTTAVSSVAAATPDARFPTVTSISSDGRVIAFRAQTSPGTIGGALGHFVLDRAVQATGFLAIGSAGRQMDPLATGPVLRRDGEEVLFDSNVASLVPFDTNSGMDVFVAVVPRYFTDTGVYRSSTGAWLISRALDGSNQTVQWGAPSLQDVPVFADYDGDGRSDIAVFRPSTGEWLMSLSSGGTSSAQWGSLSLQDRPIPADFDGDGKADMAVYRHSTGEWLVAQSGGGARVDKWGAPSLGDAPVPADYDGDGAADLAVFRHSSGHWFVARSSGGTDQVLWGAPSLGDLPVPGDYDGDGLADIAVYRGSTGEWFVRTSGSPVVRVTFGSPAENDVPVSADYDADGVTDFAIWRPGTGDWFIWQSGRQSLRQMTSGVQGDTPVTLPFVLR